MDITCNELALAANLLRCPSCGHTLAAEAAALRCSSCLRSFPAIGNLFVLIDPIGLRRFLDSPFGKELHRQLPGRGYLCSESPITELAALVDNSAGPASAPPKTGKLPLPSEDPELDAPLALSARLMAEFADVSHRSPLLDLATGPGSFVETIALLLPSTSILVCTEVRAQTLSSTRRRLLPNLRNRTLYVLCDLSTMPFADEGFSAITACGGMGEVANMDRVLRECYRTLKPGGILAMTGDQYRDPSPSLRVAEDLELGSIMTTERLQACLEQAGFSLLHYITTYEGYDKDIEPSEERCPLPAPGDWNALCVVAARKAT